MRQTCERCGGTGWTDTPSDRCACDTCCGRGYLGEDPPRMLPRGLDYIGGGLYSIEDEDSRGYKVTALLLEIDHNGPQVVTLSRALTKGELQEVVKLVAREASRYLT